MVFSSLTFLFCFLPLLLLLSFLAQAKYQNAILFVASILFYAWGEPKYVFLMLLSILGNYILARVMDHYHARKKLSKAILFLTIVLNLSLLFVFKYLNFFLQILNQFFSLSFRPLEIALPIGISFYTFQIISYVVDVYRGEVPVQKNLLTLGTYVALFPQLIAGPVVRYSTIEKQLKKRSITLKKLTEGVKRFIVGLGKKVIIANNMAMIADTIFNAEGVTNFSFLILLIAILAYTFQIYFDFSGYSDMAIGLGKMFGFEFLENFDYPYISTSITEFWHRWHISLSTWFRDYVYIPLGGNRCSKPRWIFNTFVVWILTGLWHGASWNFLLWGLYFFVLLIFEKLFFHKVLEKLPSFVSWMYAFFFINLGWLIFRGNGLQATVTLLFNLLTLKQGNGVADFVHYYYLWNYVPYFLPAILFSFPVVKWASKKIKGELLKTWIENISCLIILGICIVFLIQNRYNPFLYFRF